MVRIVDLPPEDGLEPDGTRVAGWWEETAEPGGPLRALPARLRARAGRSGLLLRPREPRRPDRLDHLRPQHRLLHRPDREEAAQPVLSGHGRALVRHARLQPGLQVLPELDHVASRATSRPPAKRPSRRPSPPRPSSTAAAAWPSPTTIRSSGRNTPSTRPGPAARWASRPWRSRPATSPPRPAAAFYEPMDAANVDLKGFTEEFYRTLLRRAIAAGARHAPLAGPREPGLAGDHQPDHSAGERLAGGHRADVPVDRRRSWGRTCRCTSRRSIPISS